MRAVLLPLVLGLSLTLAACDESSTEPTDVPTEESRAAGPAAQVTWATHPFVGKTVSLVLISSDAVPQCLDIQNWVVLNARAQVFPCHGGSNQRFLIDAAPMAMYIWNGSYWEFTSFRIRPDLVIFRSAANPNLCLDIVGGTINGGEEVQVAVCTYRWNQGFRLPWPIPNSSSPTYGGLDTELSGNHMKLEAGTGSNPLVRQMPANTLARQKWGFQDPVTGTRL